MPSQVKSSYALMGIVPSRWVKRLSRASISSGWMRTPRTFTCQRTTGDQGW
jgi:hypothetical protein